MTTTNSRARKAVEEHRIVQAVTSDPTDAPDGAIWYRSDLNEHRVMQNGSVMIVDVTAPA
jgi:hypothetical protein